MEVKILDLTRQYELIRDKIEKAVREQMESGMYIGGKAVSDFEEKFAKYIGVKHAISVNSGTDSLVIALKALGINKGDEVITTPFTFFATAEAIAMVGAVPVFVDVKEDTYNIDPDRIEEKITKKTKAILPVHIFGQPADMRQIGEIAERYKLSVIEDACQAVGSSVYGKKSGSIGDIGCFSFFPTKNMGAFGDGGMITTNDDSTAIICRALKEHGMAQNGAKAKYLLEGKMGNPVDMVSTDALYNPYKYYNYLVAHNSRLDAIQARILSIKLDYLDCSNSSRSRIAAYYNSAFEECCGLITPKVMEDCVPVWHQYAFRCEKKDELGRFLASRGVGSAAFYPVPLHLQKAFTYLGYKKGDFPIAEMLTSQTVCLPIFPELRDEELHYVTRMVMDFFA